MNVIRNPDLHGNNKQLAANPKRKPTTWWKFPVLNKEPRNAFQYLVKPETLSLEKNASASRAFRDFFNNWAKLKKRSCSEVASRRVNEFDYWVPLWSTCRHSFELHLDRAWRRFSSMVATVHLSTVLRCNARPSLRLERDGRFERKMVRIAFLLNQ